VRELHFGTERHLHEVRYVRQHHWMFMMHNHEALS
jgi:hypothetical protein